MTDELPPIRCVTCGKVIGQKWHPYQRALEAGLSYEEALNKVGLSRPCCRLRMRNPAKIVFPETQETFEDTFEKLSISENRELPTAGTLPAMNMEDEESILPPLPSLPTKDKGVQRSYKAW
jgi:DNA-directed RNA polymerase subunit N (RpoN/RPB10)